MKTSDLADRIEALLLLKRDWVSVEEICQSTGINERTLRASGKRRPLCRHFAISCSS